MLKVQCNEQFMHFLKAMLSIIKVNQSVRPSVLEIMYRFRILTNCFFSILAVFRKQSKCILIITISISMSISNIMISTFSFINLIMLELYYRFQTWFDDFWYSKRSNYVILTKKFVCPFQTCLGTFVYFYIKWEPYLRDFWNEDT